MLPCDSFGKSKGTENSNCGGLSNSYAFSGFLHFHTSVLFNLLQGSLTNPVSDLLVFFYLTSK